MDSEADVSLPSPERKWWKKHEETVGLRLGDRFGKNDLESCETQIWVFKVKAKSCDKMIITKTVKNDIQRH